MPVPLTVTDIVLPGPAGVGTADASTASTLGVESLVRGLDVVPPGPVGALAAAGAFAVELLLEPPPPPPQPARLSANPSPSAAAIILAILRTVVLSLMILLSYLMSS